MDTEQTLLAVHKDLGEIKGLLIASLKEQDKQAERIDEVEDRLASVENWKSHVVGKYSVVVAIVAPAFAAGAAWFFSA